MTNMGLFRFGEAASSRVARIEHSVSIPRRHIKKGFQLPFLSAVPSTLDNCKPRNQTEKCWSVPGDLHCFLDRSTAFNEGDSFFTFGFRKLYRDTLRSTEKSISFSSNSRGRFFSTSSFLLNITSSPTSTSSSGRENSKVGSKGEMNKLNSSFSSASTVTHFGSNASTGTPSTASSSNNNMSTSEVARDTTSPSPTKSPSPLEEQLQALSDEDKELISRALLDPSSQKASRMGGGGIGPAQAEMVAAFTCGRCEYRMVKRFSKHAYTKGIVVVQCPNCEVKHLLADNLGWWHDGEGKNIEYILKEKGEKFIHLGAGDFQVYGEEDYNSSSTPEVMSKTNE